MPKSSNLRKHLTKEDLAQESILGEIKVSYPQVSVIHVPNEGKRSDFEQLKFKVLGGKAGVSDLLIVHPGQKRNLKGLWLEVKYGKNKLEPDQMEFLEDMFRAGFAVGIVYDTKEDFCLLMDQYLQDPVKFENSIGFAKDAELKFLDFETCRKKWVKKPSQRTAKRDLEKSFEKKAKARFGTPIKGVRLPNAGKLFRSPKK